ncbi:MAG: hypothetical protein PHW25_07270 [Zoogloea sp.]|uniref:hypothetical protein n=1 Tax=Zoogloea sp. TaxID=49181 RepID=UPI00262F3E53|nr:hypothetical protein [Zoogloea sp.]MDD3326869.1 hypothetical protein [Zoogloea sp.]
MQDLRPPARATAPAARPPPLRLQTGSAASVYNGSNTPAAPGSRPETHPPPPADDSSEQA